MKRILIVEDDPIVCRIYRNKFEAAGFEVETTADGEAGLRAVTDFAPDVVQVDLMLPKLNGVEVIRRIRAQPALATLPILVLSNSYVPDLVREAWKAGANKCVSKLNATPREVLTLVAELLEEAAARRAPPPPAPPSPAAAAPAPAPAEVPPSEVGSASAAGALATFEYEVGRTQTEVRQAFLRRSPQILADLQARFRGVARGEAGAGSAALLDLYRSLHALAGYAGITGSVSVAHVASALEALVKELHLKPARITRSSLRTVAQALDALGLLFDPNALWEEDFTRAALILAVDDEPISRQAVATALGKAGLRAVCLGDPAHALEVLTLNRVDIVFLDVGMPGMDGFELCQRVRALPTNRDTPIVFVTSLSEFEARVRSMQSGGNDMIAKPFLLMELAVKALTLLATSRLGSGAASPRPAGGPAVEA